MSDYYFLAFLFVCFLRFFEKILLTQRFPTTKKKKKYPVTLLAGKESACNAGDSGLIAGSGRSTGAGRDRLPTPVFLGFPCGSAGKESTWNAGDVGSIPGLRRDPGEENSYPLQYSGLENSMGYPRGRKELDTTDFHFTSSLQPSWLASKGHGTAVHKTHISPPSVHSNSTTAWKPQ